MGAGLGRLGGFGGFGRRKKKQAEEEQAPAPAAGGQSSSGSASGVLMESTTETISYSSAAIDASKFEVPAGFKQVQHEMEKALRK